MVRTGPRRPRRLPRHRLRRSQPRRQLPHRFVGVRTRPLAGFIRRLAAPTRWNFTLHALVARRTGQLARGPCRRRAPHGRPRGHRPRRAPERWGGDRDHPLGPLPHPRSPERRGTSRDPRCRRDRSDWCRVGPRWRLAAEHRLLNTAHQFLARLLGRLRGPPNLVNTAPGALAGSLSGRSALPGLVRTVLTSWAIPPWHLDGPRGLPFQPPNFRATSPSGRSDPRSLLRPPPNSRATPPNGRCGRAVSSARRPTLAPPRRMVGAVRAVPCARRPTLAPSRRMVGAVRAVPCARRPTPGRTRPIVGAVRAVPFAGRPAPGRPRPMVGAVHAVSLRRRPTPVRARAVSSADRSAPCARCPIAESTPIISSKPTRRRLTRRRSRRVTDDLADTCTSGITLLRRPSPGNT